MNPTRRKAQKSGISTIFPLIGKDSIRAMNVDVYIPAKMPAAVENRGTCSLPPAFFASFLFTSQADEKC